MELSLVFRVFYNLNVGFKGIFLIFVFKSCLLRVVDFFVEL